MLLSRATSAAGVATAASQPSVGPIADGYLVGLAAATGETPRSAPYQVPCQAEPNESLIVLATLGLLPLFGQVAAWLPANEVFIIAVAMTDSALLATFATNVWDEPCLDHGSIWLHAAALATSPWRIGAPVGGVLR
ncbi:MAG: hypothetical protein ACI89X_003199 [Planctomycetota bacterium]